MKTTEPFRIVMRHEGPFVKAYLAQRHTMEGAVLVASIATRCCETPEVFKGFKDRIAMATAAMVHKLAGARMIGTREDDAPEHEKAGHG